MICKKIIKLILIIIILFYVMFFYSSASGVKTMLKVAFQPNLPPYQFLENGQPAGLHVDILNNIAENNNFIIEYIPMNTTTECMEVLEKGEVDIVLGVILKDNQERYVNFVESISQSSLCMIALNEKADKIKNNINSEYITATFQSGTIGHFFIQNMKYLRCIVISNQMRAFDMLAKGEVDVMIGEKNSLLYQIKKSNLEECYTIINSFVVPIEYSMAVKAANENLRKKLNTSIYQMRINGDYERIYGKWIDENEYAKRVMIKRIIKFIAIAIIASLTIIAIYLRMNILLKKQVNEKTRELQKLNDDLERQIIETRNNSEVKNRITEDNPNAIIVFDLDYIITLFNTSASKLTKIYTPPIGRNVFEIDLLNKILYDKKDQLFLEGSHIIYNDISVKDMNGEVSIYKYVIYQLFDFQDRIRGAILSIEDITIERKNREQIMEREKNKALNQMIAGVAHEIRNPVMAIKTFVELIPVKKDNKQFQDQMAKYVPKELDRINSLVQNLIDYAKPKSNNKEKLMIKDIINSCVVLISTCTGKNSMSIDIEVEDELIIFADQNQLKQILINIMLNGFESMNEKTRCIDEIKEKLRMSVKAWGNENSVFIQINDEGIGMDQDQIRKSVEPFFTTKVKGTGLGLSISKQFVEENGGTMTIESEKNRFTKVTLKFERCRDE